MSRQYCTSDWHIYHRFVQHLRGYASDDEQVEALRSPFSHVTKRDTVYVLGDVALGRLAGALDVVKSLPGTKHLIVGNHDDAFSNLTTTP